MRATRRVQFHGAAGFGLLCVCLLGVRWPSRPPPPSALTPRGNHPTPGTPSESALREAKQWQLRAYVDAFDQLEALEAWDPGAATGDGWRFQLQAFLAADRSGYFQRARASAQQAVRLARRSEETYWAARQLTSVECSLGDHQAEIRYARKLMALQPRRVDSLAAMRQAARCNGLARLGRRMESALKAQYAAMDAAQFNHASPLPAGPKRAALSYRSMDRY